jgi:cytochrome c oxidase cbb3-type subunit 3
MSKVEDKILEHNYDGILEYDNPLPRWWVWLFLITVVWGVVYMFYYHLAAMGPLQDQEYKAEFQMTTEDYARIAVKMNKMWADIKFEALNDPKDIESGKEIYQKNCVSCHGRAGEGGIGPNLTDNFYIHGQGIQNTMNTVINGVPEKGMISWKPLLKPEEIQKVSSYVLSMYGTNPPNPKPPQGTPAEK